ncbi:DUF3151 family protein [Streptomyces sp. E5N298]|uniref:DUF3151 family protein n=1 Tax=Streptomyces sp. E5N298 TaxID=1851983 RepID=UPI00237B9985|nr:DUF3151 family protein [Streptomyces sp. E5N298]
MVAGNRKARPRAADGPGGDEGRSAQHLGRAAQAIGEKEEYERCSQFLKDSSPSAAEVLG